MDEKRTIKIGFSNCGDELRPNNNFIINILKRHFNLEYSDTPDFLIVGNGGVPFQYMKYDCVRIMVNTENFSPDFTVFDYCIGFDHITFEDRFFRLPLAFQFKDGNPWIPETLSREQAESVLKEKEYFCNFIYRHRSSNGVREEMFEKLSEYKRVVSPGKYHNNLNGTIIDLPHDGTYLFGQDKKNEYVRKSKFTITCEPESYNGYVTEKIMDAFRGHSIPIYFGSPTIDVDFNADAFVWCQSPAKIDEVVEKVRYLDENQEAYLTMLMQSPLKEHDFCVNRYKELETWLISLFSQSPEDARRRPNCFYVASHNERLRQYAHYWEKHDSSFRRRVRDLIRKVKRLLK